MFGLQKIPVQDKDINEYFSIITPNNVYHISKPTQYTYITVWAYSDLLGYLYYKLKTFNVGSVIENPSNDKQIYNHATFKWVLKDGSVGRKIIKNSVKNSDKSDKSDKKSSDKSVKNSDKSVEKIYNPKTKRMVLKNGKIGLQIQKEQQQK